MPVPSDHQPARPPRQPLERGSRRARRTARPRPRLTLLQSSRTIDLDEPLPPSDAPGGVLRHIVANLSGSDWAIVVAVVITVLLVLLMGVSSSRLGGGAGPAPSAAPTPDGLAALQAAPALAPEPTATPSPTPTPEPAPSTVVSAGGARAMLRAKPSTASAILERLPDGTAVTDLGAETRAGGSLWRQVRGPSGQTGWVDASLLRRQAP